MQLTTRERQVLEAIACGETSKAISSRLAISLPTVKWHVAKVLRKFDARSRSEAVAIALARGEITRTGSIVEPRGRIRRPSRRTERD